MWEDKETTAPDPSVAPDGEQPSALARTDSIAIFEETNKQFGKMRIFSMPFTGKVCSFILPGDYCHN